MRAFHAARVAPQFKQAGTQATRRRTPNKSAGEYRSFKRSAPYSRFNAFAPELPGEELGVSLLTSDTFSKASAGTLVDWPGPVHVRLHALGCYKPAQQNELFRHPISLLTQTTTQLWSLMRPKTSILVEGDAGVGKTTSLLQAQAAAAVRGWASVHITRVDKLLDGSTDVQYDEDTKLWTQPMYMRQLWKRTLKANKLPARPDAPATLAGLLKYLVNLDKHVLLTVDNVNAMRHFVDAVQTDFDNKPLYHSQLEVPNTVLSLFKEPKESVCIVGATTGVYSPIAWTGDAYAPKREFDPVLSASFAGTQRITQQHFTAREAQEYVRYLQLAGLTAKPWLDLYQAGNGNPRTMLAEITNYAY